MYSPVFCSVVALLICASRQTDYYMSAIHHEYSQKVSITVVNIHNEMFPWLHLQVTYRLFGDPLHLHLSVHQSLMQLSQYLYAWLGAECCH